MLPESVKPENSSTEGAKQKELDREIREMVSAITSRSFGADLQKVHKPGSSQHEDEDDHGIRIITLAGSNTGATLRSELDDKSSTSHPPHGVSLSEQEALSTYVNSNFQAINNSIMLGGSYTTNDPGVHMDISDFFEHHDHKPDKQGKKGKKKEKETSKSDQHSDHSD